jgi:hypothetical protein
VNRIVLLLLVGISLSGCSTEARQEMAAKRQALIEANKIPPVNLSEQQTEKLKALVPNGNIVWLRAGQKRDGNVFVCHVTEHKNIFGGRVVTLFAGTFEADGSYQRSLSYLVNLLSVQMDCLTHGFDPPVTIRANVSVMRI